MNENENAGEGPVVGIRDKLNTEAGKLEWHELEKFFAKGAVIKVAANLDLIDVAAAMAEDDVSRIAAWRAEAHIGPPSDDEVVTWLASKPLFWAVVVAPWVVIQEIAPE